MDIADRKPKASRFEADSYEVRLARLREQAPVLGSNRRLRIYAILGSVLMVLSVAAFYLAMEIYKRATQTREEVALIEVDRAPEIKVSEAEKALARIEAEQAAAEITYQDQLEELKKVDLLDEKPAAAAKSPGQ